MLLISFSESSKDEIMSVYNFFCFTTFLTFALSFQKSPLEDTLFNSSSFKVILFFSKIPPDFIERFCRYVYF